MINKEDRHAPLSNGRCSPAPQQAVLHPQSHPLWVMLPVGQRERILGALSRLVAQQLAEQPGNKEVSHEALLGSSARLRRHHRNRVPLRA